MPRWDEIFEENYVMRLRELLDCVVSSSHSKLGRPQLSLYSLSHWDCEKEKRGEEKEWYVASK